MTKVILTDEQHAYCKERIRERVKQRGLSKNQVSLAVGKSKEFLRNYLCKENGKTSVDTIYRLYEYLRLPFDEIFGNSAYSNQTNYIVVRSNGLYYAGNVIHRYVDYGKKEITCMRFVNKENKALRFQTRRKANKVAKKFNGIVLTKIERIKKGVTS